MMGRFRYEENFECDYSNDWIGNFIIPEYLENIIGDYFEGSSLVIFAFLVIVVPISIAFEFSQSL